VTRAASAESVARWATEPAIDLWVVFGEPAGDAVERDGGVVHEAAGVPSSHVVFDAMRSVRVEDVRRVGVVSRSREGLVAGRQSGAGAVIGIADKAADASRLLDAEPDAVVTEAGFDDLYAARFGSGRRLRPQVLLNPGPALTSDAVKRAAAGVDLCHREPEYVELDTRVREQLRRMAGVGEDWGVAIISGSGTAANEMALRAAVRPGRQVLVVVNGVYGERLRAMAERAEIDVVVFECGWTEPADPAAIGALLDEHPVDAVALVHHETTTGLLNPAQEIAALAREAGVRVVLDAVSSFGVEELVLEGSGIDFLACSSNKCLQGLPGAAFVLVSPAGLTRLAEVPPSSVYLDLAGYLRGAETGSVPFTPPIPAVSALAAALDELFAIGPAEHRRRYAERAAVLDEVLAGIGLEPIVAEHHRSRTVRSVPLPPGATFMRLHDELKRDGYVIYAGQGALASEIFRVCCMGTLEPDVLRAFGQRLAALLEREPSAA